MHFPGGLSTPPRCQGRQHHHKDQTQLGPSIVEKEHSLSQKGIIEYEYKLEGVMNAEISLALFVSGSCQYPFKSPNLVTVLAEPT